MDSGLPWWPAKRAAAEQVQMQVKDALARILADVPDEPIAGRGDTLGLRHHVRRAHHRRQEWPIRGLNGVDPCDMAAWNDQRMRRRLGIQVAEGHHIIVAIDLLCWERCQRQCGRKDSAGQPFHLYQPSRRFLDSSIGTGQGLEARRAQKFAGCCAETLAQEIAPLRGEDDERTRGATPLDARQHTRLAP